MNNLIISSWNINRMNSLSIEELVKIIVDENCNILFLHEFPTDMIEKLIAEINEFSEDEYSLFTRQEKFEGSYYITLSLIRSLLNENVSLVNPNDSELTRDIPCKLRWIEMDVLINNKKISVFGVHCPIYKKLSSTKSRKEKINKFWDKFVNYTKSKEFLIIGDLNGNLRKRNLFANGVRDIINSEYVDLGAKENRNTFCANTRIDYALIHKSLIINESLELKKPKYLIQNKSDTFKYSDHEMITLTMNV